MKEESETVPLFCCIRLCEIFVHKKGILCTELPLWLNFVHEKGILCTELPLWLNFVHEKTIFCTKMSVLVQKNADSGAKAFLLLAALILFLYYSISNHSRSCI